MFIFFGVFGFNFYIQWELVLSLIRNLVRDGEKYVIELGVGFGFEKVEFYGVNVLVK